MLLDYNVIMQQLNLEQGSKVVRISSNNYKKIVARAKFGMTFNEALSNTLEQYNQYIGTGKSFKNDQRE
jgi:antitoxin component of MazEF toxin-antitoxin module